MATYKFDNWNSEIVNPTVSFDEVDSAGDPVINNVNKADMTIEVRILMTDSAGSQFRYPLDKIAVVDLNYTTAANVMERVMTRLKDFEV